MTSPALHCPQSNLGEFDVTYEMPLKYQIDKETLEREYFENGKSQQEIGRALGIPQTVISARMKKFGLKAKNRVWKMVQWVKENAHKVNENYFDYLNVENTWVLGWLASDGYVREGRYTKKFGVRLAKKDAEIVKKLKSLLGFDGPIYETNTVLKKTGKKYELLHMQITSAKIVERLKEFGIVENKSLTIGFPKIIEKIENERLTKSFIFGVFEGDGSVLFDEKSKSPCFQIVGTKEMLSGIQNQLIKYLNLRKTKLTKNTKLSNHYALRYRGKFQAIKIFDWLYEGQQNYLTRKYQRYLEIKGRLQGCAA
jgi:hypothetical protein